MPRYNLVLRLEYLGGHYAGSQIQKNGITIQELLDKALSRLFAGEKIKTIFSGRTDSGVHALGQTVSAAVPKAVPAEKVKTALNALLPSDIRINDAAYKPQDFQPRYAAKAREYLYNIYYAPQPLLYLENCVWWLDSGSNKGLDIKAMRKAAGLCKGRQDFSAFCAAGSTVLNKVRRVTVSELKVSKVPCWPGAQTAPGLLLTYRIKADGFLYHMVRNITAAIVAVGLKKMTLPDLRKILQSKDRRMLKAPTAPAQGLVLLDVCY